MIDFNEKIQLTDFAKRHFDPKFGGTKIFSHSIEEFGESILTTGAMGNVRVQKDHEAIGMHLDRMNAYSIQRDGYADFCKIITLENFTDARVGAMKITLDNYQYLRSGYSSRRDSELPVLSRWFDLPLSKPRAEYLQLVVYSREQLLKEHEADEKNNDSLLHKEFELAEDVNWGVVAILGQESHEPEPMKPATILRNALGKEEGGSGVPIDREEYEKSVAFWKDYATVK